MILLVKFLIAFLLCMIVHELGHFLVAMWFGYGIKFRFAFGNLFGLPIPRGIWDMPDEASGHERIKIALAGFGFEMLIALLIIPFFWQPAAAAVIHFLLYQFYAGEDSDFKWLA